jgi:hypothetical protein
MIPALGAPHFFARLFVERDNRGIHIRVAVLNHEVIHHDRAGGRPPGALETAQVARPERLALDRVGVNPPAAEKGNDNLAVRHAAR